MKDYYYQDELYIIEKEEIWEEDWYFLCQYTIENGEVKKGYTIKASRSHNEILIAMDLHNSYLRHKERDIE